MPSSIREVMRGLGKWLPSSSALFALLAVAVACGPAAVAPSISPLGGRPTVTLQSALDGTSVPFGQGVVIAGVASDSVGIDHVDLVVDGVVAATATPPQAGMQTFQFTLNWTAGPAGPRALEVTAYRPDGTYSDPATIALTVVVPGGSLASGAPSSLPASQPPTPHPSRNPRPSRSPKATPSPTEAPTETPTTAPTQTPTEMPTATPTLLPTPLADGTAPDDQTAEPHEIVLVADNLTCATGPPSSAVGCIWEQISAPTGDNADRLFYVPAATTSYMMKMTSCSDQSDMTIWQTPGQDPSLITGCGDWLNTTTGPTAPASIDIDVMFNPISTQTYNLYQYTVYQCAFVNCGNQ